MDTNKTQTFSSFKALAAAIAAEDVRKAQALRKSAPLRKGKANKNGPAVAR